MTSNGLMERLCSVNNVQSSTQFVCNLKDIMHVKYLFHCLMDRKWRQGFEWQSFGIGHNSMVHTNRWTTRRGNKGLLKYVHLTCNV